jgi:hypothetical protein
MERHGSYPATSNFPALLGQAFAALGMELPQTVTAQSNAQQRLEASLYESGCSINAVRNKQGTGHGRPWVPSIGAEQAKIFVELMGCIAEYLLCAHKTRP